MAILTDTAIEGYKTYTERTLGYASYKIGSTWTKAEFSRMERMSNGKIAVYFSIIPQLSSTITITGVRLYNTKDELWAEKTESIKLTNVQEGVLYRFTFDIREEEE